MEMMKTSKDPSDRSKDHSAQIRAKYVSVTLFKNGSQTKFGMKVDNDESTDELYITNISDDGIAKASPLMVGDRVVCINDTVCYDMEKKQFVAVLRTLKGRITITARNDRGDPLLFESMVEKQPHDDIGINIVKTCDGQLKIGGILASGIFSQSLLAAGDRIKYINSIPAKGQTLARVNNTIERADRFVSIVTEASNIMNEPDVNNCSVGCASVLDTSFSDNSNYDDDEEQENGKEVSEPLAVSPKGVHLASSETIHDRDNTAVEKKTEKLSPVEPEFMEPDIFGQKHPIETPELIAYKLQQFDEEVTLLPLKSKKQLMLAQEKCPEILTQALKLKFLRCEVFREDKAAVRFATYWERRVDVFGPEKAFMPLTASNCIHEQDMDIFRVGAFYPLTINGRTCIFYKTDETTLYIQNTQQALRLIWYCYESAMEDEIVQRKGFICFLWYRGIEMSSGKVTTEERRQALKTLQGAFPIRFSAMFLLHPPFFLSLAWRALSFLLPPKLRQRVMVYGGSKEKVLENLSKHGFNKNELPVELGGEQTIDMVAWIQERKRKGL